MSSRPYKVIFFFFFFWSRYLLERARTCRGQRISSDREFATAGTGK